MRSHSAVAAEALAASETEAADLLAQVVARIQTLKNQLESQEAELPRLRGRLSSLKAAQLALKDAIEAGAP